MPCYEPTDPRDHADLRDNKKQIIFLEACLCSVLSVLKTQNIDAKIINAINEGASGVGKEEVWQWWLVHQKRDRERTERERKAKAKAKTLELLKASARSKLSSEELKALGIK